MISDIDLYTGGENRVVSFDLNKDGALSEINQPSVIDGLFVVGLFV